MAKSRQQIRQKQRKGNNKQESKAWIYAIVAVVLVAVIGVMVYFAVKPDTEANTYTTSENGTSNQIAQNASNVKTYTEDEIPKENVKVKFEMENGEHFIAELYPKYAPQTVANFVSLVEKGFYNGLTFHRVVEGFMAQGGDPQGTGMGGSEDCILGEFSANGVTTNTLSHKRGVISMARSQDPNSASSQFFICYDDASFLDGSYAAFGEIVEGMDTVDNFLKVERSQNEMGEVAIPKTPIIIKNATIVE